MRQLILLSIILMAFLAEDIFLNFHFCYQICKPIFIARYISRVMVDVILLLFSIVVIVRQRLEFTYKAN